MVRGAKGKGRFRQPSLWDTGVDGGLAGVVVVPLGGVGLGGGLVGGSRGIVLAGDGALEGADALAEGGADFRQAFGAENQEDNQQDYQYLGQSNRPETHFASLLRWELERPLAVAVFWFNDSR